MRIQVQVDFTSPHLTSVEIEKKREEERAQKIPRDQELTVVYSASPTVLTEQEGCQRSLLGWGYHLSLSISFFELIWFDFSSLNESIIHACV